MSFQALYQSKRVTPEDAIDQLRNGDFIVVPTGVGEPPTLLTALSEQRRRFQDIKVAQILAVRKFDYFDPETVDHVRHMAFFFGGASRAGGQKGSVDFIPCSFSDIPVMIQRGQIPADVVFSMASPMDEKGFFSLSLGPTTPWPQSPKRAPSCSKSTPTCRLLTAIAKSMCHR
jgi:acyl-CoA hydrolase